MKITENMMHELLTKLNKRLKDEYIKDTINIHFICNMIQIKKISVYDHKEKKQITVTASE